MYLYTLFGSNKYREVASQIRQGAVVTVFGSAEVDLTEAELAYDVVILNIINALGETSLKIPADWAIESTLATVLGETHGIGHGPGETTQRLRIQGLCFLGEVRIERRETPLKMDAASKPEAVE